MAVRAVGAQAVFGRWALEERAWAWVAIVTVAAVAEAAIATVVVEAQVVGAVAAEGAASSEWLPLPIGVAAAGTCR